MSAHNGSQIFQRASRPRRCRALPSLVLHEEEDPCASESDYEVDDPKDPDYIQPQVSQTATPDVRIVKNQRRDPGLKERANAVAVPSDTSVLTGNTNAFGRVQAAHGVARNISYRRPNLMIHLEYYLGFDAPETFCLDTPRNIWLLDASEHIEGDRGAFGPLPLLPDLVTVFKTAGDNRDLPAGKGVRYHLKWKPTGDGLAWTYNHLSFLYRADTAPLITHQGPVDSNGERPTTQYRFPYRNLRFRSPLHIVFAIVDLWLKYDKYGMQDFWDKDETKRMNLVLEIMAIWLEDPPTEFLELPPGTQAALAKAKAKAKAPAKEAEPNDGDNNAPETPSKKSKSRETGAIDTVEGKDLIYTPQNAAKVVEDEAAPPAGPSNVDKGKGKAVDRDDPSPHTERAAQQPADAGTSTSHPSMSGAAVPEHNNGEQSAVAPEGPAPTKARKPKAGRAPAQKRRRDGDGSDGEYTEARPPRKQARKPKAPTADAVDDSETGPSNGRQSQPTKKGRR